MCGHARMSRNKAKSDVNGDFYFYLFIIDLFFCEEGKLFLVQVRGVRLCACVVNVER